MIIVVLNAKFHEIITSRLVVQLKNSAKREELLALWTGGIFIKKATVTGVGAGSP